MNKLWVQKQNILPEGMPQKFVYQKRVMKDSIDLLNEEFKPNRNKEKFNNIKFNEFQRSSSSKIRDEVSPYAKTMLLKIGKHIKRMKQSIADITKMNALYLEEKAKKSLKQKSKKSIKKIKMKRNNSEAMFQNRTYNNQFDYLNSKKDSLKKDDYVKNFVYVNDNYRKQLNFAFLKYNPTSHLDNLKVLVQAEPIIRKDIKKITNEVEEDIKWKCDKHHFKKKYLNLIARNERSRTIQKRREEHIVKSLTNSLPQINTKLTKKATKPQKSISSIYNQINLFERLNKKEKQKINAQKEQAKEEIRHMLRASDEIKNLLQNENINDKIELFKTDYAKQMYYPHDEGDNENLLDKDYFINEKRNIVEKIGTVYSFKMNKTVNEKEKIFKGKINNENEKFRKKIKDGKRCTMEEFNNYMNNNQVKLQDNNKTNDSII